MRKDKRTAVEDEASPRRLIESEDYYFENGLMVFTAEYLRRRGYCCENSCRHCPYSKELPESSKLQ